MYILRNLFNLVWANNTKKKRYIKREITCECTDAIYILIIVDGTYLTVWQSMTSINYQPNIESSPERGTNI